MKLFLAKVRFFQWFKLPKGVKVKSLKVKKNLFIDESKNDKRKNIKTKLWISFKQSKTQLQQTQLACTANTQH